MELKKQATRLFVTIYFAFDLMVVYCHPFEPECLKTKSSTPSCIITDTLPVDESGELNIRAMPSIGNGYLATCLMSDEMHVSGLFNGRANVDPDQIAGQGTGTAKDYTQSGRKRFEGYYNHTHRARIPSTASLNFTTRLQGERSFYVLDVQHGVFVKSVEGTQYSIQQTSYAHRLKKNIIVTELAIHSEIDFELAVVSEMGPKSLDIDFQTMVSSEKSYNVMSGRIRETETETSERVRVSLIHTKIPEGIQIKSEIGNYSFSFITAVATSLESDDPTSLALEYYNQAVAESAQNSLLDSHTEAWNSMWLNQNITIGQNLYLAQTVFTSFYNILSSVRDDWKHGLSPGSLPEGFEYLGHTFWDQDIWMYPPVLMFYPKIAQSLLDYRYNRLEAAMEIAKQYNFKGAMFPWESALSGFEVCPQEVYGRNEIHITGDIAFAVNQYFQMTHDLDWLRQYGFPVLYQSALFWESRVTLDTKTGLYVINDVMPPDEYHYPVNNSVYTNVIAQNNLILAIKFGHRLEVRVPEKWQTIADNMYIPYDATLGYHPEYEGFDITDPKSVVKQADTILINFPLQFDMAENIKENDLHFYSKITDPNGPAMTHSMFSIGWNDIGNADNANDAFEKNFQNIQQPFFVWSEIRGGQGATNFITAAGGYLQAIVFGYGGIRIKEDGLHFNMRSLPHGEEFCLNGIKYLGNTVQFCRHRNNTCLVRQLNTVGRKAFLDSTKCIGVINSH